MYREVAGSMLAYRGVHVTATYPVAGNLVLRPLPDFSRSRGEISGESLGSKLRHRPEMVDSVSTNRVHVTY